MKRLSIIILSILLLSACGHKKESAVNNAGVAEPGKVTLVDLGSMHCKPCLMMLPVLDAIKKKYRGRAVVKFIDVNKNMAMARSQKIITIPTQIIFDRQGREVSRHVGYIPQADLEKKLDKVL
jgi:thioredoxin 1